jgi:hypothetical protein
MSDGAATTSASLTFFFVPKGCQICACPDVYQLRGLVCVVLFNLFSCIAEMVGFKLGHTCIRAKMRLCDSLHDGPPQVTVHPQSRVYKKQSGKPSDTCVRHCLNQPQSANDFAVPPEHAVLHPVWNPTPFRLQPKMGIVARMRRNPLDKTVKARFVVEMHISYGPQGYGALLCPSTRTTAALSDAAPTCTAKLRGRTVLTAQPALATKGLLYFSSSTPLFGPPQPL